MSLYKNSSRHQHQTYTVDYTWILDNFEMLYRFEKHLDQESPKFPDNNFFKAPNNIEFYLKLIEQDKHLGLAIINTSPKNSSSNLADFIITMANNTVKRTYNINESYRLLLCRFNELFADDSKLLPAGKLIIHIEITMIGDIFCTTQHGNALKVPKCKLSEDFYATFQTGDFSDVTIETADGHKLKAHKVILSGNTLKYIRHFYS